MPELHEDVRVAADAVATVTQLLQRVRSTHPTAGLYEAADLQWWWRMPRPTDDLPQLFWFAADGRPEAAAIVTAWTTRTTLDLLMLPDATDAIVRQVVDRGLAHAAALGFTDVTIEADGDNRQILGLLAEHGFTTTELSVVEAWMDAAERPGVSPLHPGYHLTSRETPSARPHHMIARSGPDVEARLRETSLYRADLDLAVIHDATGDTAAYGLFWYDPTSATGLVEPMRTEDAHQRRGLARHVLTAGVDLLARAGAARIKICYEPDNPASGHLYRDVGFRPCRTTVTVSRPATSPAE